MRPQRTPELWQPPGPPCGGFVKHTYVRISWRMTYLIATTNLSDTYVSRSAEIHHPLKIEYGRARKYVRKKGRLPGVERACISQSLKNHHHLPMTP